MNSAEKLKTLNNELKAMLKKYEPELILEDVLEVFDLLADKEKLQDFLDRLDQFDLDRLYNHKLLEWNTELLP